MSQVHIDITTAPCDHWIQVHVKDVFGDPAGTMVAKRVNGKVFMDEDECVLSYSKRKPLPLFPYAWSWLAPEEKKATA